MFDKTIDYKTAKNEGMINQAILQVIFAQTYHRFGLETVRHPVVEVEARVAPFDNGAGCTLKVLRAGKPRFSAM